MAEAKKTVKRLTPEEQIAKLEAQLKERRAGIAAKAAAKVIELKALVAKLEGQAKEISDKLSSAKIDLSAAQRTAATEAPAPEDADVKAAGR